MSPESGIQRHTPLCSALCSFEYTGWMDESNSIVKTGCIGDWFWPLKVRITGRDAIKRLEQSTINGCISSSMWAYAVALHLDFCFRKKKQGCEGQISSQPFKGSCLIWLS